MIETAKLLLKKGGDPTITARARTTVLHSACLNMQSVALRWWLTIPKVAELIEAQDSEGPRFCAHNWLHFAITFL